ncbi:hypothetical protein L1887_35971 [Cichorium endivia]|nr:hypothetical protein L1887_35971 [Cichorium endivia]
MDVEKSSLCNCVVNFLLEENYVLSAFELLHELLDDGRDDQAIRLKEFFADPVQFPPDQISRFNSLRVADPQSLLEEKEALEEKLAIRDYENRLAQEDILKLKTELQKKSEAKQDEPTDAKAKNGSSIEESGKTKLSDLGPLKPEERQDLNCAVKEYLLLAGYRLTAMTFYEEVTDQDLDDWENSSASVPDALRHYYYQYLSSTTEAAEEKLSMEQQNESLPVKTANGLTTEPNTPSVQNDSKKGPGTIQILSDALPKIVPYVLINHREELLPLMMCAIERHPDSNTRDSLTHTLFNLIKRPDEQQRRIIMDACVSLARNVGEMRTETELLPQCWEQISHMYEERRLLVAQSCGELAGFVRPEIRDSLILSIVQQLIEDSATVVREAAARNLALLLPLFPNMDKYIKVEEMMFHLVCDPSGAVVDTTIKELVPAVLKWGNKLDHILRVLLSHMLSSVECCPPVSGVEDSVESHFHVLGERERWTVDVLLRLLLQLLPVVHQLSVDTCPYPSFTDSTETFFSLPLLKKYAEGRVDWPTFEWLHDDCFPSLIQIVSLLPQKEDSLRKRISSFLLAVSKRFGDDYLTHIILPLFLVAVGDNADLSCFPSTSQPKIKALRPIISVDSRIATLCVLPVLLAGVLGFPNKHELLTEYLRNLLIQSADKTTRSAIHSADVYNSVRFLCLFDEQHNLVFNILWEMVVSSNMDLKINAAKLLKVIVPYIDAKVASSHVLPALVTLGSEPNLHVLYASIDAFGTVAQNFKNDVIVDKIRVQMDAFLEDGSHEATLAVIRALVVAVPHTTESLKDYIL